MGFSRQEYWTMLSFPSLEDLPDLGMNAGLLHSQAESLQLSHQISPRIPLSKKLSMSCSSLNAQSTISVMVNAFNTFIITHVFSKMVKK